MKIGEVAEQLNTTVRTLRYYEEQGLVEPGRTSGGTRQYDADNLARFRAILLLADIGIPLATLRELAQARQSSRSGDQSSHTVDGILAQLLGKLGEQKRQISKIERDLNKARTLVKQCFGCKKPPTRLGCSTCPVSTNLDSAQALNLIWDPVHDPS